MNRRDFIKGVSATAAMLGIPSSAMAASASSGGIEIIRTIRQSPWAETRNAYEVTSVISYNGVSYAHIIMVSKDSFKDKAVFDAAVQRNDENAYGYMIARGVVSAA